MMNDTIMKKDPLSIWKIALGAIFLFNPTFNIVDPLPDFIGLFFMASGMFAFSHLSDKGYVARRNMIYLAVTSIAKLLVCLILPSIIDDTFSTLMAFSFSVVEAVFFFSAFRNLFECISSLGMRSGDDSIFSVPLSKGRKKQIEKLRAKACKSEKEERARAKAIASLEKTSSLDSLERLTFVAFFVRAIGAVLPTLPALSMVNVTFFPSRGEINWNDYIGPIYILCWIACLATGIPWLRKFRRYFKGIIKNRSFTESIYERFRINILSDPLTLAANRAKAVMLLALTAIGLCAFVPIDGINVLPNVLPACLFIGAFILLIGTSRLSFAGIAFSGIWGILSIIGTYLQSGYSAEYGKDIWSGDIFGAVAFGAKRAIELFNNMVILSIMEAVFFGITLCIFGIVFKKFLRSHIDMMPKRLTSRERDPKKLTRCLIPVRICAIICVLANGALIFSMRYLPEAWLINSVLIIAFFAFSLRAYYRLDDNIYDVLRRKF